MPASKTTKRSIRFRDEANLCSYHGGAILDQQEVVQENIWYLRADMRQMKQRVKLEVKYANSDDAGTLLEGIHEKEDSAISKAVHGWSRRFRSLRGLEKYIDPAPIERFNSRQRYIASILEAQEKMLGESHGSDLVAEFLSELSTSLSRHSRVFARIMAAADRTAVLEDITSSITKERNRPSRKIHSTRKKRKSTRRNTRRKSLTSKERKCLKTFQPSKQLDPAKKKRKCPTRQPSPTSVVLRAHFANLNI